MFAYNQTIYLLLYFMSVVSFALYAYDKHLATYGKHRIPEAVLFGTSILLGAFGSLCGMLFFNHKTRKSLFNIGVPVILFIQILGLAFYFTR